MSNKPSFNHNWLVEEGLDHWTHIRIPSKNMKPSYSASCLPTDEMYEWMHNNISTTQSCYVQHNKWFYDYDISDPEGYHFYFEDSNKAMLFKLMFS